MVARVILISMTLLLGCASVRQPGGGVASSGRPRTVILSLDALRKEFLTDSTFETPAIKALLARGAFSLDVIPVYPSVTYPSHTTLATGASPSRHGVLGNRIFTMGEGPTTAWYWDARDIRVPTLWQAAKEAGMSVALLNWPVSAGADAEWVVPEVFPRDTFAPEAIWAETERRTRPEIMRELASAVGTGFTGTLQKDEWMTEAARHLLRRARPDLLLLHLAHGDLEQHFHGKDSLQSREAWRSLDRLVKRLTDELDLERDCLFIVGDHGFADVSRLIHINTLFAREGWLTTAPDGKLASWKVIADLNGAQASIYVREPALAPRVLRLLRKHSQGNYRIVDRRALDGMGAFPDAFVALEPVSGAGMGSRLTGSLLETLPHPHGEHGFAPDTPGIHTSFLAAGSCATPGKVLGTVRLVDVGPTIAQALGLRLPGAEGRALSLKSAAPAKP
ncbi:MAG: ectonucleotide pyrophosphatase/phosphodiesterase [Oligoflexia bacterium]|nr:ectonucleotide pyrophosphatase/phosphodiesterase [Oligoflexia bacterium]